VKPKKSTVTIMMHVPRMSAMLKVVVPMNQLNAMITMPVLLTDVTH